MTKFCSDLNKELPPAARPDPPDSVTRPLATAPSNWDGQTTSFLLLRDPLRGGSPSCYILYTFCVCANVERGEK